MIRNEEMTTNAGTICRRLAGGRASRMLVACIAVCGILAGSARAQCGSAARKAAALTPGLQISPNFPISSPKALSQTGSTPAQNDDSSEIPITGL